jgi:stage II sporulation protein M
MVSASKKVQVKEIIMNHIQNNLREYIIVSLMFVLGIFLGVMFINNSDETKKGEIATYINSYIETAKVQEVSTVSALVSSIKDNAILACMLWLAGTTLIGIPIVFGIVLFRGFCLGYAISASVYSLGTAKGIAFVISAVLLQNILFIPAVIALGVSGFKLYKSVMKDKRRENIKVEILRHTVFSVIMLAVLIASAVVKINVSGNIVENVIKYF